MRINLVPKAFSSFKMTDRRNPWPGLLKYSKNRGVFCHVTHDEMAFSEVVSSVWRPCLFSCNLKPLFKRNEDIPWCLRDKIPMNFWSHFGSLGQGFLRSAILNEKKALGTRLHDNQSRAQSPQGSWSAGGHREKLWGNEIVTAEILHLTMVNGS